MSVVAEAASSGGDPRELRAAAAQARRWLLRTQSRAAREVFIGPDQAEAAAIADFIDRLVAELLAAQAASESDHAAA